MYIILLCTIALAVCQTNLASEKDAKSTAELERAELDRKRVKDPWAIRRAYRECLWERMNTFHPESGRLVWKEEVAERPLYTALDGILPHQHIMIVAQYVFPISYLVLMSRQLCEPDLVRIAYDSDECGPLLRDVMRAVDEFTRMPPGSLSNDDRFIPSAHVDECYPALDPVTSEEVWVRSIRCQGNFERFTVRSEKGRHPDAMGTERVNAKHDFYFES